MASDLHECAFCHEQEELEDMQRCAGCGKLGCYECVEWCSDEIDEMDGGYFCERCTMTLVFEVGRHYRTRDGRKASVLLIRETYMTGEIEDYNHNPITWNRGGGWFSEPVPSDVDLVAEWRDPARVTVLLCRNTATGRVRAFSEHRPAYNWELIAQHELVEGEGLE